MLEFEKCTGSIEHTLTGEIVKTKFVLVTKIDQVLDKQLWIFDWKKEFRMPARLIFKMVSPKTQHKVHGLLSISFKEDHIFMNLIENASFNFGSKKLYTGVAGSLIAFACQLAFDHGFEGYLLFESKTRLISHYQNTIGVKVLYDNKLYIATKESKILINRYLT